MSATTARALLNTARKHLEKKRYGESEKSVLEVLRYNMNNDKALALLAEIRTAGDNIKDAVVFYMMAIRANPLELSYKEKFVELVKKSTITQYDELTNDALVECLKSAEVLDCTLLGNFWFEHLLQVPAFHATYDLTHKKAYDPANKPFFDALSDFQPLLTPLFLLGIKNVVVHNRLFEGFLTHIRRYLLEDLGQHKKFTAEESLMLATALAHYCFYTEFIFDTTDEEQKRVDTLRMSIESGSMDATGIAVFACYEPLYTLKNRTQIAEKFSAEPAMADMIKTHITDYEVLYRTAAEVMAITPIDDAVSMKVREQYEEFPYPRWKYFSKESTLTEWKSCAENISMEGPLRAKKVKILIAGCGTGHQALDWAVIFPAAEILAVDLSRTSLAYAINKAAEYNIKNVTFRQADILQLGTLGQTFDYVTAGGVLHHMKDPAQGWRVLCDLLKPGGLMKIALYSKIARQDVIKTQDIIKRDGHSSDARSMKIFRKNSPQILGDDLVKKLIVHTDYYYLSMYRDLLFHVQEYNFDLLEIDALLQQLGLAFAGFPVDPVLLAEYDTLYPDDPKRLNLRHWHQFEEKYPDLFRTMYRFWCRKKD